MERINDPWFERYHALSAYLRACEFDLLHDHTLLGPALGAMLAGVPPVVHTLHGPWTSEARAYYELLNEHVHLVAISETQRRANPAVRYAATIPNGIDLDSYPFADGNRDEFLVYIGRANSEKAPELAVELANRARRPLKLVVKRSEPDELEYWERKVEPRLHADVEVLSEISHDEKVGLLQRGRAFVFPIRWEEPFGLVMIEALACGMPVIATPRGAAREIITDGETGFLCSELDQLAAAIKKTETIAPSACRARVEKHYSAAAMVSAYEELFHRIIADPPSQA
jgi:glycosyltransferase involved in cell wall biosynthesis